MSAAVSSMVVITNDFVQAYGEIRLLYSASKHRGLVIIAYYDIRAAVLALHAVQGRQFKGSTLDVSFSPHRDEKEASQVCLVCRVRITCR